MPEDPAKDHNFQEPIIDSLRAQKDDVSTLLQLKSNTASKIISQFLVIPKNNLLKKISVSHTA
jgi:hypothetical protein